MLATSPSWCLCQLWLPWLVLSSSWLRATDSTDIQRTGKPVLAICMWQASLRNNVDIHNSSIAKTNRQQSSSHPHLILQEVSKKSGLLCACLPLVYSQCFDCPFATELRSTFHRACSIKRPYYCIATPGSNPRQG